MGQYNINDKNLINKKTDNKANNKVDNKAYFEQSGII